MTGATATTAELPQIEFPTPIRVETFLSSPNNLWPTKYETNIPIDTASKIITSRENPDSKISLMAILAPINITANSKRLFPDQVIPIPNEPKFGFTTLKKIPIINDAIIGSKIFKAKK